MVRACVVMMAVLGAGVAAQDPAVPVEREVVPAVENAALRYWEAWFGLSEHMRQLGGATYTPDGIQPVLHFETTHEKEVAKVERVLNAAAFWGIDKLVEASKIEYCDFQRKPKGERELGEIPHLDAAEQSARLLAADAGRLLASNEPEGASERLATIFRMAEHIGRGVDISDSQWSIMIFEIGYEQTALFQDYMTEDVREILVKSLERFPDLDPFRLRAAFREHARFNGESLAAEARSEYRDLLRGEHPKVDFEGITGFIDEVYYRSRFGRLSRAKIVHERLVMSVLGRKITDAWHDEASFSEIMAQVSSGRHGFWAMMILDNASDLREEDHSARKQLTTLRAWASGETETLELPEEEEE